MNRRVVITGLGVVAANANDVASFWKAITEGQSGIKRISLFDTDNHPVKIAGEVKDFVPYESLSAKEVRRTDRFSQFGVAATKMALEDSRIDIDKEDTTTIGVVIGTAAAGLGFGELNYDVFKSKGIRRISPYVSIALMSSACSSQISLEFKVTGTSFTVSTASASGNDAIGQAFRLIKSGECDVIIAGGSEAPLTPFIMGTLFVTRALSPRNDYPEKVSRPFDKDRNGFVLAEGAGILILEELMHAQTRKAKIYAEIVGYGATCDAYHMTEAMPTGKSGARAIELALKEANLNPDSIDYINAHGTSTPLNDERETIVIKRVFEDYAYKIPISSIKSTTGHTLGAAGAIEAVACAMVIKEGIIPPTINYETKDPKCDLDYVPNKARKAKVNASLSNSFGFGGKNAVLIFKKFE